jgi:prolyl oligopeptidase
MKPLLPLTGIALILAPLWALAAGIDRPAAAPVRPVTETLWGRKVTDDYRYMESMRPETIAWIKAQGAYTRGVLDSIEKRAVLAKVLGEFAGSFGVVNSYESYGGRAFYEEQAPGSDNFDLMVSGKRGVRKLVDITALRAAHGGMPYAINYFLASPDGSKVAVGISQGGSEAALLSVYDAATGKRIAGPVDRADFGATAWTGDSRLLYFIRLRRLAPGEPATDKYKRSTADVWDLKSPPVPVAGSGIGASAGLKPGDIPAISLFPGSPLAILTSFNGVQNELKLWTAPAARAADRKAPWKLLAGREAQITAVTVRGDEIFLLSHKHAPNYQVLALRAGQPLSAAKVLVPAAPGQVIDGLTAAADALYVFAREGAYSRLLRVPSGTTHVESVALPAKGHVFESFVDLVPDAFADPRKPGLALHFSSWVIPDTEYRYEPASGRFTNLGLDVPGKIRPADYRVSDLQARARDGVEVPLTLIERKGARRPEIVYVEAYGSYGISRTADFSPYAAEAVHEGIARAVCHVRGGGEEGDTWYRAGKGINKHNSWQDLIACASYLLAHGFTTQHELFILGASAGGITVGRALTERPDLFAGAVDLVPLANTLRFEFSPAGTTNIPEFGSIKTEQGFKNLYAMDSIAHVRKATTYPAVLITTGLNDPRVAPWIPAKFAASLQASGSPNPVLLRVESEAGHGVGSTRTQWNELEADIYSFMFWRAGRPGWQPKLDSH